MAGLVERVAGALAAEGADTVRWSGGRSSLGLRVRKPVRKNNAVHSPGRRCRARTLRNFGFESGISRCSADLAARYRFIPRTSMEARDD